MYIPFDNNSGERYVFEIDTHSIETGDGIVLKLNRKACESFAELFGNLALESEHGHVHLGYGHEEPQGPGVRIEVDDT